MKFMHLADLHIGKNVNGYSLLEDQKFALDKIIELIEKENIKFILIAGDIYQTSVPSADSIKLFDDFLSSLNQIDVTVLIISGNHDSSSRLAYASNLLKSSNIYISKEYAGEIEKVEFKDEYEEINFYLFPYVKPSDVKHYFPDENIESYSDAIRTVLDNIELDSRKRNVILSHQFILNAERSDSEEIFAGESEAVGDIYYDKFDYVALGHIHKKQSFLDGKIRYPGSLLKYSKSEANYQKSILIVEMKEKGNISFFEHKIEYLRDMRIIKKHFDDIIRDSENDKNKEDYIHFELLDEEPIYNDLSRLKEMYPNIMTFKYANMQIETQNEDEHFLEMEDMSELEIFKSFYNQRRGKDIDEKQIKIIEEAILKVWGQDENN